MKFQSSIAIAMAALGLAWAPLATPQAVQPPVEQSAAAYSDAELKSFAVAVVEVQRITEFYVPRLRSAMTIEERQQLHDTASVEMTRAVEQEGLSAEKFHDILTRARADAAFAERIRQHILQPE